MTTNKEIKLRFEKWSEEINQNVGTIRTIPENYYVASIERYANNDISRQLILTFHDIEACTLDMKYKIAAIKYWDAIKSEVKL